MIYLSKLCVFSPFSFPSLVLRPRKGIPCNQGYESWYQKTTKSLGYPMVKTL